MPAYSPPARSALRTSISRDLHDTGNAVFTTDEVNDLINMGIAELNLLAPKEYRGTIVLVNDTYSYALTASVKSLHRVELWRLEKFHASLPRLVDLTLTGWDVYNGTLYLPTNTAISSASGDKVVAWGYQVRDPLTADGNVLDADLQGEMVIRAYAAFTAFQRLITSRALFQQWQTAANNSDVSPTQLLGMASVYSREWKELRGRVRRLRRAG